MDKKKIFNISKSIPSDIIKLNEKMKLLNNIFSLLLSISNKNSKNKILDEYTIVLKNYKEFINKIMNKLTEIPFYIKYKNIIIELNEKIFTLYKNLKILYIIFKLSYSISNKNKKENIKDEYNKYIEEHKLFIRDLIKNLDDIKILFNKEKKNEYKNNIFNQELYELTGITPEELNKYKNSKNIDLNTTYKFIYKDKINTILKKYNLNKNFNIKSNFNKIKADLLKNKNEKSIDNHLYKELLKLIIIKYYTEKIKKIGLSNKNGKNDKLNKVELELKSEKEYINNESYNELIKFINSSKKILKYKINNKNIENNENIEKKINTPVEKEFLKTKKNLENILKKLESEFGEINNQNLQKNSTSINLPNYLKNQEKFKEKLNEINKLENKNKIKSEVNKLNTEIIDSSKYISNDDFAVFLLGISNLLKKKVLNNLK